MPLAPEFSPTIALDLRAALALTAVELHPSTAPDAIAAQQRAEVAAYRAANPGAAPDEIAAALTLPVWSVEVRLAELDGRPIPYRSARKMPLRLSPYIQREVSRNARLGKLA